MQDGDPAWQDGLGVGYRILQDGDGDVDAGVRSKTGIQVELGPRG